MYQFSPEEEIKIKEGAKNLIGKSLRCKELCEELDIEPPNGSKQKDSLFKDLANIFNYSIIPNGKQSKYVITQVYDKPLLPWYDRDEWYWAFKTSICEILKANNYQPVWLTRTPLLSYVGVVNNNYRAIMSKEKRQALVEYYNRSFDTEYEGCKIIGNLLADRVYDGLRKMDKERIITYTSGYAIQYRKDERKNFYPVSASEHKSAIYQFLFEIDNQAIDEIKKDLGYDKAKSADFDRTVFKALYFYQVIERRNSLLEQEDNSDKLKELGVDFDCLEGFYDVKYIIPDKRLAEEVTKKRPNSIQLLNQAAIHKITESKSKSLKGYELIKAGLVDVCIDLNSKVNYSNLFTKGEYNG